MDTSYSQIILFYFKGETELQTRTALVGFKADAYDFDMTKYCIEQSEAWETGLEREIVLKTIFIVSGQLEVAKISF